MKIYRVATKGTQKVLVQPAGEERLLDATPLLPNGRPDVRALIEAGPQALERIRRAAESKPDSLAEISRAEVRILAPYRDARKIICVGRNYLDHCREQNTEPPARPMLFAKFANALADPGAAVVHPPETTKLDYEGELVAVIGRGGRRIPESEALGAVFGYSILNDISARDLQKSDGQWLRAKSADGFAPWGPCIVTADEIPDPQALAIRTYLNGEIVQDSNTREMIFSVAHVISYASQMITLEAGDLLSTGTPAGVGVYRNPPRLLCAGDRLRVEIPAIGELENTIASE